MPVVDPPVPHCGLPARATVAPSRDKARRYQPSAMGVGLVASAIGSDVNVWPKSFDTYTPPLWLAATTTGPLAELSIARQYSVGSPVTVTQVAPPSSEV